MGNGPVGGPPSVPGGATGAPAGAPGLAPTPGATGGASGGAKLVINHGKTAKALLRMQWTYPVYGVEKKEGEASSEHRTGALGVSKALPVEQAFLSIAGDDPRPLLILRECEHCNGTDDALLSKTEGNERTLLMARWFHCVKLPTHVMKEDHPYTKLFADYPGKDVPHLFLVSRDGKISTPLKGDQSPSELWEKMESVLAYDYKKDPKKALKEVQKILVKYDTLDEKEALLEERMQLELEENGPKSRKLKKLKAELESVQKERDSLKKNEAKLMDLGLFRKKVEKDVVISNLTGEELEKIQQN